ncbi:MAG: hypothetical protein LKF89_01450 [Bacilli bacterium]|jgi:hypothetical protein|nr:hypothetical protein [Bacilli bacterium]
MKKNDAMGYVAYGLMIAIGLIVGFIVLRPVFSTYYNYAPLPPVVIVLLALLGGILINALLIELGHLLGAKVGKYTVVKSICLGVGFKRTKDGKKKMTFSNFDGLTGETIVIPNDIKKSNPRHMIYFPLLFLLIEVIGLVAGMIAFKTLAASEQSYWWWYSFLVIILAMAGMIYLYDIFPFPLDSKNDGYLLPILTNDTNKEAYNQMLQSEYNLSMGLPEENTPVYDSVTDFTVKINNVTLFKKLQAKDYDGALDIIEKTIASKKNVSSGVYNEAMAQKCAIYLLKKPLGEAKQYYIDMPLDDKKYIASLSTSASVRAYLLISGLVEESYSESEEALNKADQALRHSGDKRPIETALLKDALDKVAEAHKDWDFTSYAPLFESEDKKETK